MTVATCPEISISFFKLLSSCKGKSSIPCCALCLVRDLIQLHSLKLRAHWKVMYTIACVVTKLEGYHSLASSQVENASICLIIFMFIISDIMYIGRWIFCVTLRLHQKALCTRSDSLAMHACLLAENTHLALAFQVALGFHDDKEPTRPLCTQVAYCLAWAYNC